MTAEADEQARRVERLEELVGEFARELTAAQDAGVSHAVLLPRLMLAFRAHFGEPPAGFVMPALPGLPALPS
jgi:hypothetical protein